MLQIQATRPWAGTGYPAGPAPARALDGVPAETEPEAASLSLSTEARNRLDELAGVLPGRSGTAANLTQRLADPRRQSPLPGASGRSAGQRIADIQGQLEGLLQRLHQALLFGDRRALAALAREAGALAKELATAVKDAAQAAHAQNDDTAAAGSEAGDGGSAAAVAASASQMASQALARQGSPLDPGLQQTVGRILVVLRGVVRAARAMLRPRGGGPADLGPAEAQRKQVAAAEQDLGEAEADIQKALAPEAPAGDSGQVSISG